MAAAVAAVAAVAAARQQQPMTEADAWMVHQVGVLSSMAGNSCRGLLRVLLCMAVRNGMRAAVWRQRWWRARWRLVDEHDEVVAVACVLWRVETRRKVVVVVQQEEGVRQQRWSEVASLRRGCGRRRAPLPIFKRRRSSHCPLFVRMRLCHAPPHTHTLSPSS